MVRFYGTLFVAQEIHGLYLSSLNQNGTLQEPFWTRPTYQFFLFSVHGFMNDLKVWSWNRILFKIRTRNKTGCNDMYGKRKCSISRRLNQIFPGFTLARSNVRRSGTGRKNGLFYLRAPCARFRSRNRLSIMKNAFMYFLLPMQLTMQVQIECANRVSFDRPGTVRSVRVPLYLFTIKKQMTLS